MRTQGLTQGLTRGLKGTAIAIGVALAAMGGVGTAAPAQTTPQAAAAKPSAPATGTPAAGTAAAPANTSNLAPTTAAATPPANPSSPQLAMDGAPVLSSIDANRAGPDGRNIGRPTDGMFDIQPQVTRNGRFAYWFHNSILFPLITAISLFVLILLVVVVVRFRRAANPIPSKTSHNTFIEVIWTAVPVLILAAIALPSIGLLRAQFKPAPAGAVTLKAIGNQWYWTYQYPDHGGFEITANMLKEKDQVVPGERARTDADGPRLLATDNRIVLPVGVPIRLITTSNDVIHSWAVPAFWIKLDAIPGRLNETSFTIERPGLYFGQCSELCGPRHAFMPIAVEAVAPAQFAAWVRAKGGTMPGARAPSEKVIPQPGAEGHPAAPAEGFKVPAAGPNPGTAATPAPSQGATNNRTGAGNAGL
ncbi:cytochrome c oxidase subunit 2 [Sphingomonas gellani]|uniref:Cytochrome c oxidase subunit 2 n=1 Tax=Sphingomonas gellani TaxID=1166340 RepID=A0A1H8C8H7_9SPHN|nr:cytochrome c oxidase subunit II [Sphingomonas gellani]SEM90558.1 cytochrome c oxidase subunit 2 [Sphingomonas gellani]